MFVNLSHGITAACVCHRGMFDNDGDLKTLIHQLWVQSQAKLSCRWQTWDKWACKLDCTTSWIKPQLSLTFCLFTSLLFSCFFCLYTRQRMEKAHQPEKQCWVVCSDCIIHQATGLSLAWGPRETHRFLMAWQVVSGFNPKRRWLQGGERETRQLYDIQQLQTRQQEENRSLRRWVTHTASRWLQAREITWRLEPCLCMYVEILIVYSCLFSVAV